MRSKTLFVGVDPGFSGAVGVLNERGIYIDCFALPVRGGDGRQREFDVPELCSHVHSIIAFNRPTRVFLEWPTTRPDESAESSKRFGVGLGILEGVFTFAGFEVTRVSPNKWKGRLGLMGKEKDPMAARLQAVTLAEEVIKGLPPGVLRGVRGGLKDGHAEALLIAWEAVTGTLEGLRHQPEEWRLARLMFGKRKKGSYRSPL